MEAITGFGLSNKYEYTEVQLDSLEYLTSQGNSTVSPLNWPTFRIGGDAPLERVAAYKVIQAEVPFTYYVFTTTNGTFVLEEDAGGGTQNIVITPGNYTISQMLTELKTQLELASVAAGNSFTYTITFNDQTQKITYVSSDATGFSFTFGGSHDGGTTNPRLYIGFPWGDTDSVTDTLVSPNVVLLSGPNYLYINSQKHGAQTNVILTKSISDLNFNTGNRGPQIARVPISVAPGEIITYRDPNPEYWFNIGGTTVINEMDIYLSLGTNFTLGQPLDLNGLPFSLTLGVLTLKSTNDQILGASNANGRVTQRIGPR